MERHIYFMLQETLSNDSQSFCSKDQIGSTVQVKPKKRTLTIGTVSQSVCFFLGYNLSPILSLIFPDNNKKKTINTNSQAKESQTSDRLSQSDPGDFLSHKRKLQRYPDSMRTRKEECTASLGLLKTEHKLRLRGGGNSCCCTRTDVEGAK